MSVKHAGTLGVRQEADRSILGVAAGSELDPSDVFFFLSALGRLFELRPDKRPQHS